MLRSEYPTSSFTTRRTDRCPPNVAKGLPNRRCSALGGLILRCLAVGGRGGAHDHHRQHHRDQGDGRDDEQPGWTEMPLDESAREHSDDCSGRPPGAEARIHLLHSITRGSLGEENHPRGINERLSDACDEGHEEQEWYRDEPGHDRYRPRKVRGDGDDVRRHEYHFRGSMTQHSP